MTTLPGLPGRDISYWMDSAPADPYPALDTRLDVDVAVVGAGIAGLCAAWELTRAGRRVAVLEAGRVAGGVTGHTTAKLTALHTLVYGRLTRERGPDAARLYARSQQEAVEHVARVCAELDIDCDLEHLPAHTYTTSGDLVPRLRAEADAARAAGLPASFVTGTGLPFPVAGAVRVEDQAQFHPRKYLLALAADITRGGGVIHERTRVTGLREGRPCRLTTEDGVVVTAGDVVVATHYPVFDRALLFGRLEPHRELVVGAVLPADQDPAGMYLTPRESTRSVRTAPYGDPADGRRLLVVTGESFTPGAGEVRERYERLVRWTTRNFPGAEVAYRWAAQDNTPAGGLPYVGRFHPGARHVYVATGFGGWGMSNGVMAGSLLAALIVGPRDGDGIPPWAGLYDPRRMPGRPDLPALLGLQASVAGHFVGDRIRAAAHTTVDDIAPGSGAVVRSGARHDAVYRDDDGNLHALSARCTHLGCFVRFNDAERTWECPCHGSRFGVDGEVLQGPATRPLARREPDA